MMIHEMMPWKKDRRNVMVRPERSAYPLGTLQRRMNRMFDDFFGDFGDLTPGPLQALMQTGTGFSPRMDVTETEKEFVLTAELAGLDEKDVGLTLDDNVLTITGEKKVERDEDSEHCRLTERSYGTFSRSIGLPTDVEADNIDAVFKKGILTVRLPKTAPEESATRKIEIKTE